MPTTIKKDGSTKAMPPRVAPEDAAFEVADGDGDLRGEGPWHDLRESQRELVSILGDTLLFVDQVAVHESYQSDRSAKTEGAKVEKIPHQLCKCHGPG